jgi:hypothetical protein
MHFMSNSKRYASYSYWRFRGLIYDLFYVTLIMSGLIYIQPPQMVHFRSDDRLTYDGGAFVIFFYCKWFRSWNFIENKNWPARKDNPTLQFSTRTIGQIMKKNYQFLMSDFCFVPLQYSLFLLRYILLWKHRKTYVLIVKSI